MPFDAAADPDDDLVSDEIQVSENQLDGINPISFEEIAVFEKPQMKRLLAAMMKLPPNAELLPASLQQALSQRFEHIVVFSGAGMSADSGIPTFRSGKNGLWGEFNPADLATPQAWENNKALVWGWYEWRRGLIMRAQPNPGHLAVARLQQTLGAMAITQNVDDLHERAGVRDVLHLHGSMFEPRCSACGHLHMFDSPPPALPLREIEPPQCLRCKGFIRPGVVWFGEQLPEVILSRAQKLIGACDLLIVVGTSGVVYPAAGLIALTKRSSTVIEINPEATIQTGRMDHVLRSSASQTLPALVECLERLLPTNHALSSN